MAQNKNNNKNGGDCCSFCGAKRTDVEIMFQGSDGANICNKCIENGYKIIVDNDIASERGRRPAAAPLKMEELLKPAQIKETCRSQPRPPSGRTAAACSGCRPPRTYTAWRHPAR